MKKLSVAAIAVLMAATSAPSASAADIICGSYYGTRICTPIRRTGPAKPTTHATMIARATPATVEVGGSVSLWMGPKKGQNGFKSGEIVRFFDIYKGKTSEIIGIRDAIRGGIARWGRQYLSMPGVDPTGIHHLCAMGERTGKLACVKVNVVWGKGSGADDSYGGVAGGDTYGGVGSPTNSSSTTVAGGFAPPTADGGFGAPSAG